MKLKETPAMSHIIYCGVDFHARQQTICCLKTETGELTSYELKHDDKEALRKFYSELGGPVIVGLEASGYTPWFEEMLEELRHQVWLGDAAEIRRRARRRQKNDRRDAELILDLLCHDEFPRIHRPSPESREILRMLRYRQKLVKVRTLIKNSLQSLSLQAGLSLQARLFTRQGTQQLEALALSPVMRQQRHNGWNCCRNSTSALRKRKGGSSNKRCPTRVSVCCALIRGWVCSVP